MDGKDARLASFTNFTDVLEPVPAFVSLVLVRATFRDVKGFAVVATVVNAKRR